MSAENERSLVFVCYALHLVGSVAALPSVVALVLNYLKRRDIDPLLASHHRWMIRTFWWAIVWSGIGVVALLIWIGWLIILAAWIWYVYRHVRGIIDLVNGEAMPA